MTRLHSACVAKVEEDIKFVNDTFYKPNTAMLDIRDRMVASLLALRAVLEISERTDFIDKDDVTEAIAQALGVGE